MGPLKVDSSPSIPHTYESDDEDDDSGTDESADDWDDMCAYSESSKGK